jgi:ribose/xylose/arabinose/galactoside ABC-type transport system permease subunit
MTEALQTKDAATEFFGGATDFYGKHRGAISVVAPILLLIVLIAVFTWINPRFLSWPNVFNLMRQSSVLLLVATGTTFVILMGSIDLSIGSVVTLCAISTAALIRFQGLGLEVIPIAALIGATCGLLNASLIVWARIPSFIATLGTMIVIDGAATWIGGGSNIMFRNPDLTWISSGALIWRIPNSIICALTIFVIAAFVGLRTKFGRHLYAIGAGERTSRLSGINVRATKFAAFTLSGVICGLAGFLLVARTSTGMAQMAEDLLLQSIAAVVMGGTALTGGVGGVHRTIIGVLVIAVLTNGLNVAGVHKYYQIIVTGLVVIMAVTLTLDRSKLAFVK